MSRVLVLTCSLLAACVSNGDEGILIIKNVAPGTGCTFTAAEDEPFISHGVLDTTFAKTPLGPPSYVVNPQMKSRITALDTEVDQKTIITNGADVDVTFADDKLFSATELTDLKSQGLTHFKELFTAPITPNGGLTDAGFVLLPADLVSAIDAKDLGTGVFQVEVITNFTVHGSFSGSDVSSQSFQYAITVGRGLVFNQPGPLCPAPTTPAPRTGNPCNQFQDGIVDCCTEPTGGALTCPARTM